MTTFFAPALMWAEAFFGGGEDTGRFNDILCAALFPRNFAWVLAAVNIDRVAVYYKLAVLGSPGVPLNWPCMESYLVIYTM